MWGTMKEVIACLQQATEQGSQRYDDDRRTFQQLTGQLSTDTHDLTTKDVIHARCLLSEYADYYGQYREAAAVLGPYAEAPNVLGEIDQADPKRAARLRLQLGRIAYRKRRFKEAETLIEQSLTGYRQR